MTYQSFHSENRQIHSARSDAAGCARLGAFRRICVQGLGGPLGRVCMWMRPLLCGRGPGENQCLARGVLRRPQEGVGRSAPKSRAGPRVTVAYCVHRNTVAGLTNPFPRPSPGASAPPTAPAPCMSPLRRPGNNGFPPCATTAPPSGRARQRADRRHLMLHFGQVDLGSLQERRRRAATQCSGTPHAWKLEFNREMPT